MIITLFSVVMKLNIKQQKQHEIIDGNHGFHCNKPGMHTEIESEFRKKKNENKNLVGERKDLVGERQG